MSFAALAEMLPTTWPFSTATRSGLLTAFWRLHRARELKEGCLTAALDIDASITVPGAHFHLPLSWTNGEMQEAINDMQIYECQFPTYRGSA